MKMNKIRVEGFIQYFFNLGPHNTKNKLFNMKILEVQKHDDISKFFSMGHLRH